MAIFSLQPPAPEDTQWSLYQRLMDTASQAGISFAIGGSFARAAYTGTARDMKDLDLYITAPDRARMIDIVTAAGMTDYFDQVPYDRQWIYRATRDGTIVDLIWAMANRRALVDSWWMSGPTVPLHDRRFKVVPAETLLWDKLYIMQRDRCDWPDVMNLLYYQGEKLDWRELLHRLQDDVPLLTGALSVFSWLSPAVAGRLPEWLWPAVRLPQPEAGADVIEERAQWFDMRPWFAQSSRDTSGEAPTC